MISGFPRDCPADAPGSGRNFPVFSTYRTKARAARWDSLVTFDPTPKSDGDRSTSLAPQSLTVEIDSVLEDHMVFNLYFLGRPPLSTLRLRREAAAYFC
jgi:hypothetical protein